MKNEMMSSGKGKRKITLDPRTKLALLLMVATFVLGGAGGNELIWARILLAIIPAILLLFSGKVKAFFVFEMLFLAGCLLQYYLLGKLSGFFSNSGYSFPVYTRAYDGILYSYNNNCQ